MTLRNRFLGGDDTPDDSRQPSPSPAVASVKEKDQEYKVIPSEALHKLRSTATKAKRRRPWKRYVWTFSLGGIFAMVVAAFFTTPEGSLDKLVAFAGLEHMDLSSLLDVLPAGLIRDVNELQVSASRANNLGNLGRERRRC